MAYEPRVFLSHKKEDSEIAGQIGERLERNQVGVYLDVIDGALLKDGPDLGEYLRSKLRECHQLLAVVSPATRASWWVPWEIGVATERSYRIATFATQTVELPGYLEKWPYLRTATDIDTYAQYSKVAHREILAKAQQPTHLRESLQASAAKDFHRTLKRALGQ